MHMLIGPCTDVCTHSHTCHFCRKLSVNEARWGEKPSNRSDFAVTDPGYLVLRKEEINKSGAKSERKFKQTSYQWILSQSPTKSTETLDADDLKKKFYLKLKAPITFMLFNLFQSLGEEGWHGMIPLKFLLWAHCNIDGQTPPKRAKTNFILIKQNPETDTKTLLTKGCEHLALWEFDSI